MKQFKLISIIIIMMSIALTAWADDQEYTKVIKEEYQVQPGALVKLGNKYGNIEIASTESNTVSIEVEIIVEARSESRAEELMDRIEIDMSGSRSQVSAFTNYEKSSGWKWGRKENYKVHYTVSVPRQVDLDIQNKYGNVTIDEIDGDVELGLKYGNGSMRDVSGDMEGYLGYAGSFTMGSVGGDLDMEISYSTFEMGDVSGDADLESKYSKVSLGRAVDVDILSKYDKYEIESAQMIENEGKYDNFKIGEVGSIDIDTKYTSVRIEELSKSGIFDTGYGSVKVKHLASDFQNIEISSGYTGYSIDTDGPFQLDLESKYVSVDLPDMEYSHREKDSNELYLKGYHQSASAGKITAVMKYGMLDIR